MKIAFPQFLKMVAVFLVFEGYAKDTSISDNPYKYPGKAGSVSTIPKDTDYNTNYSTKLKLGIITAFNITKSTGREQEQNTIIAGPATSQAVAMTTEVNPWQSTEVLTGAHDPTVMRDNRGVYTLLSTNNLCEIRQSTDMVNWQSKGRIFSSVPGWMKSIYSGIADLWAPQISYRNGRYWVYYCGSSFGSSNSIIGVTSTPTLDTQSPNYKWTDHGEVIRTNSGSNYNAIDPDLMIDKSGRVWLTFGSWWSGIKMIEIDPSSGKRLWSNSNIYSIAGRNGSSGIEGPTTIEHNGYYYLLTSWDACCNGTSSTYRTMGGRSTSPNGGYTDKQNRSLTSNNSEEFLRSYSRYIGPGGGSLFRDGRRDYYAHHYYNGNENGNPRLQIRELVYYNDWPVIAQPFLGRRLSYEAEHALLTNAKIIGSNNSSNKQYVGSINAADSKVRFYINAFSTGDYTVKIHYAAGDAAASQFLKVNNNTSVEVMYPKTSAWGQFPVGQAVSVKVSLKEGGNLLEFSKGTNSADLDRIDLVRNATGKIEGGATDNSIGATFVSAGNNSNLSDNGWIMMENIDFSNGKLKNFILGLANAATGQIKISIDALNSNTNTTITLDPQSKIKSYPLPANLESVTGIHDVYISLVSGKAEIDYYQFSTSSAVDCNNVADGTAVLDDCGQCTGGNTGKKACTPTEVTSSEISESIKILPNPFAVYTTISCKGPFNYEIYNVIGNQVEAGSGTDFVKIGENFRTGIYFVKIYSVNGTLMYKLQKD